jgi:hypothetical protein
MRIASDKADLENVADVNATIGGNPKLAHPILQALEALRVVPARLAQIINARLEAGKNKLPVVPVSNAQPEGREITLQGSQAIEIHVQVNGQTVRAVLLDALFNKSRTHQNSYAEGLGGRLATRQANRAVACALLKKKQQGNLNPAEAKLLKTYRDKWVRDSQGGLVVVGRRVHGSDDLYGNDDPNYGALVDLPLAESK